MVIEVGLILAGVLCPEGNFGIHVLLLFELGKLGKFVSVRAVEKLAVTKRNDTCLLFGGH